MVGGDTLTRASYYTQKRVRVTGPDGREYMFDRGSDSITVIDHKSRVYWKGSRALTDSVAKTIIARNREGIPEEATTDPVAWGERLQAFNDSIKVIPTNKVKKIAGYPCDQWLLTAGSYLQHERWIARSLIVPNYGPELEKAVLASIKDPLNRQLMRLLIGMRTKEGIVLAASTKFRGLSGSGNFSYQAVKVISTKIPQSAWAIPAGYTPVKL